MGRIRRGFNLLRASWEVLKADKELMLLPIFSFILTLLVAATFLGGAFSLGVPADGGDLTAGQYVLLFLFYFFAYFIGIFFNAAVVGAATIRLEGGDPTVRDGLRLAWAKFDKIFGWAAIAATVGIILRSLEERAGFLGRIAIALIGVAWSAITFFVVPVLLYEPVGVFESIKRSVSIFKERWGEQFTGNISIGLAVGILTIPIILVAVAVAAIFHPLVGIILGIAGVAVLSTAGAAMTGIFNAALYRFATTGKASGAFTEADLSGAFAPRKGS